MMDYLRQNIKADPALIPQRIAVVMRWNRIGRKELQRELNYCSWYFNNLMEGKEPPDELDMERFNSMFGSDEMKWALGLMNMMPPWLKEDP